MNKRVKNIMFVAAFILVAVAAVALAAHASGNPAAWSEGETPVHISLLGLQLHLPMLAFTLALGWSLVLMLRELSRSEVRLHRVALVFLLGAGVMLTLCKPAIHLIGWDEGVHRNHVAVFSGMEDYDLADYLAHFNTWFFGYIPYTVGMGLGNLLGLGDGWILRLGFLCGAAMHAVMTALAVKHAPRCKLTFLAMGCLPTCLVIATNVSYDGTVIASILLAAALLLEELSRPKQLLGNGRAFALSALLTLGTLPKPAYSLTLMLLWLLPQTKFASKGRCWAFRAFVLVLLAACMVSMLLGMYDDIIPGDERMDNTDSAGQIADILANPGRFLLMLGRFLVTEFLAFFPESMAAWACWGPDVSWVLWLLLATLVLVCPLCTLGEKESAPLLTSARRWALGLWGFLPLLALMVTQYLVSTPVAHTTIDGMQERYLLPVMILLLLCAAPPQAWRERLRKGNRWITLGVLGVLLVAVYSGAWRELLASIHLA